MISDNNISECDIAADDTSEYTTYVIPATVGVEDDGFLTVHGCQHKRILSGGLDYSGEGCHGLDYLKEGVRLHR